MKKMLAVFLVLLCISFVSISSFGDMNEGMLNKNQQESLLTPEQDKKLDAEIGIFSYCMMENSMYYLRFGFSSEKIVSQIFNGECSQEITNIADFLVEIDVNERKINQFLNGIYKSSVEVLDNHRNEMAMKLLEHYEKGDESDNIDSYLEDRKIPI